MITDDGEFVVCDNLACEQRVKNHRWGKTKAEGWFFTKSGLAFCPTHIPTWVTEWRKKSK